MIEMDNKRANDREYFAHIINTCFNQDTGDHFYSWILETDEFDDVDPGRKVNNERRSKAI